VIVTTISSIFAVRYLKPNAIINAILLPYGGLAAAITIFLPLLIFFMFLHSSQIGSFGRRAGWFIYGTVFIALWLMRPYEEMTTASIIYLLGLGFIILSFIFDGSVHKYFKYGEFSKIKKNIKEERAIELIDKIRKARNSGLDRKAEELEKRYRKLIKA